MSLAYRSPPRIDAKGTEPPSYEKSGQKRMQQSNRPSSPKVIYTKHSAKTLHLNQNNESTNSSSLLKKMNTARTALLDVNPHMKSNDRYYNSQSQIFND